MDFGHTEPNLDQLDKLLQDSAVERLRKKLNKKKEKKKPKEELSPYKTKFDEYTEVEIKALRLTKQDPIDNDSFYDEEEKAFVFKHMWDPFTGERLEEDPIGPLYFNPINLIFDWYRRRLDNIWTKPSDEEDGYWSGVPGDLFGAGEDCYVPGRGFIKDKYLFRLPLSMCYIPKEIGYSQAITMGPKLTDEEIEEIYDTAKKYWERDYRIRFRRNLPDLVEMKKHYDLAITKNPLGDDATEEENYAENKRGVDYLMKLR